VHSSRRHDPVRQSGGTRAAGRKQRRGAAGRPDVVAKHGVLDEDVFFIPKPFSMHALAAKVRQALDSTAQ
jgi:hypothetical protein